MWIYSSGFPKSQDIGKSIDRQSGKAAHKAELSEVKAILKQLYAESGKSTAEISRDSGFNAGGYLKTDFKDKGWANNLPKDDKWITLKSVLGCGDEYDDYFVTTPQIKVGEKETGCFDQDFDNYTIGARSKTVDITQSQTEDGRQWSGWGTQLKPAHEPIALARKPIKLSIARNCQVHGTGALNIDACRVPYESEYDAKHQEDIARGQENATNGTNFFGTGKSKSNKPTAGQRTASFHNATGGGETQSGGDGSGGWEASQIGRFPSNVLGEIADYQKYFYCPKVSRAERHIGHDTPPPMFGDVAGAYGPDGNRMAVGFDNRAIKTHWQMAEEMGGSLIDHEGNPTRSGNKAMLPDIGEIYTHGLAKHYADWCKQNNKSMPNVGNNHPTVKPIALMKYLIRLITPPGGTVLDPFNGSGSTGCAAVELGHEYIGCELDPAYVEIAKKRIDAWYEAANPTTFNRLFDVE
jgi:site-specific DNA-methyltransferase (adenine-specific)